MYNPSRGGVRGGADQFTWESVKTDKHRENYLGHSLKAPVGRWQKGKDLSWYAKERNDAEDAKTSDKSELAAIKRAEQEAMMIALGHNVIRKENQSLTKEEMSEALKSNIGDRDQLNIERVDGVGAKSGRAALLTGTRLKNDGVTFEANRNKAPVDEHSTEESSSIKRSKNKKSKKHKKEKKKKNLDKSDSDYSENEQMFHKKSGNQRTKIAYNAEDSEDRSSSKHSRKKEKKNKRRHDSSDSDRCEKESTSRRKNRVEETKKRYDASSDSDRCQIESSSRKKYRVEETKKRHDTEESNDSEYESAYRHNQKNFKKKRHDTSDSDEPSNSDLNHKHKKDELRKKHLTISNGEFQNQYKTRKDRHISRNESNSKSSKHLQKKKYSYQNADSSNNEYYGNRKETYKFNVKKHRHDTSESD